MRSQDNHSECMKRNCVMIITAEHGGVKRSQSADERQEALRCGRAGAEQLPALFKHPNSNISVPGFCTSCMCVCVCVYLTGER